MLGLPTPALTCVRMCICRIIFPTGASNNHNDSFPFVLAFASFSALHHFWRAWFAALLPPLVFPFPPVSSGLSMFVLSWGVKGGGGTCCCGEGGMLRGGGGGYRNTYESHWSPTTELIILGYVSPGQKTFRPGPSLQRVF